MSTNLVNDLGEVIGITYRGAKLTRSYSRKTSRCRLCRQEIPRCYRQWRPILEAGGVIRCDRFCDPCGQLIAKGEAT